MSCDNEFDENEFQPSPGNEVNGLPFSNGSSLIDSLTAWDDIPDMDFSEKHPSPAKTNYFKMYHHFYKDYIISVSESSLLIMSFAVRDKLSGVALEDFRLGADSPSLPKV